MINAILFDMDGVVANSIPCDFLAWKKIFSEYGRRLTIKTYNEFAGRKSAEIIRMYLESKISDAGALLLQQKKEKYFVKLMKEKGMKSPVGLKKFLRQLVLAKYKIALATAADRYKAREVLKHLGVAKYFRVRVTAEDVSRGKPDPEIFLAAARKLRCAPGECVVIEDSPLGIQAAKKGGMIAIGILTSHSRKQLRSAGADKIIKTFKEINLIKNESL